MSEVWRHIDDFLIRHVWKCSDSRCDLVDLKVYVEADFYAESGIPVCEMCDAELGFVGTEMRVE